MAISGGITLYALSIKKRVREPKYAGFGNLLKEWRAEREIETVVRMVRSQGVEFDGATLRGWEYGWIGRPDPLRLLALANVYGRSVADVMAALATARGFSDKSKRDLLRHASTETSTLPPVKGESDGPAQTRIRQLEGDLAVYKAIVRRTQRLAAAIVTAAGRGGEGSAAARRLTKRGGNY